MTEFLELAIDNIHLSVVQRLVRHDGWLSDNQKLEGMIRCASYNLEDFFLEIFMTCREYACDNQNNILTALNSSHKNTYEIILKERC